MLHALFALRESVTLPLEKKASPFGAISLLFLEAVLRKRRMRARLACPKREAVVASERQINANRANAKRSTGPKTAAGKRRSSRNALKHGLSASMFLSVNDMDCPSGSMVGDPVDSICDELLQAQSRVLRVRRIRIELLAVVLQEPSEKLRKRLITLDRYERAALRQRKTTVVRERK